MPLDTVAGTTHLSRVDPVMRKLIKDIGPCELRPGARGDHFTTLLRAIVGQQLSARAAETIFQRLAALYPDARKIRPEDILATPDAELRSVGLSGAKAVYVRDLAAHVADGRLKLAGLGRRSDEAIVSELIGIKGIGRWTVEMFLIFKLGRPDVWPVDDLGIRNAFKTLYAIEPTKPNLFAAAEKWRPWRSVASWYLWRSLAPPATSADKLPPSLGRGTNKVPV